MIVSNEPGYYEPGAFGIRVENLLIARPKRVAGVGGRPFNDKKFLGFEQLTHVPIDRKLIDHALLTPAELQWLDDYHGRVWARISPLLPPESEGYAWLRRATEPLQPSDASPAQKAAFVGF
eukprot:3665739-Prymnesium_polylepis.1